jgi:hypothetical protein
MRELLSTGTIMRDALSSRVNTMIDVLIKNSVVVDSCQAGYVELHWGKGEVHGKVNGRLNTDDLA